MKVQSTVGNITFLERSRKGEDSTQKEQGQAQYFEQQGQGSSSENPPSEKELEKAAESYGQDPSIRALGLETQVEGTGPGLRVTLKDGRGAMVRQYTGEEFLKLREAAQVTGRGKLLDKKL